MTALLTRKEAAKYLGLTLRTFERHVQRHLPTVLIGARPFFMPKDLDEWVEAQRKQPNGEPLSPLPPERFRRGAVLSPEVQAICERLRRPSKARRAP